MPFNVCLTCTWESLVPGCAFYYTSVIKEKTPTQKIFPFFFFVDRGSHLYSFSISFKKATLG